MAETLDSLVFGKPITNDTVIGVNLLCEFIQQEHYLDSTGIFRKSGSERRKRDLKAAIDDGQDLMIVGFRIGENGETISVLKPNVEITGEFTLDDACCVLKKLITSLPESIFKNVIEDVKREIEKNHLDFSIFVFRVEYCTAHNF